jgi:hypothetical protein
MSSGPVCRRRAAEVHVLGTVLLLSCSSVFAEQGRPANTSLYVMAAGALSRTDLVLGTLEGRASLTRNLFVSAAPVIVTAEGGDHEYQFRAAATLLLDLGPLRLDDRNLWVFSDSGTARYRNRLRLTAPISSTLRLQLFDEACYQRGGPGWFRNAMGTGVGFDVSRKTTADVYWMIFDDRHRSQTSMFVVSLTIRVR